MKNFKDFCNEEQWSGDVETKKHPKEGLFAEGTAKEISDWCIKSHKDLKGAMTTINFYINRAGDNLTAERKKVLEDAKELVHKHFSVNESTIANNFSEEFDNHLSKAITICTKYKKLKNADEASFNNIIKLLSGVLESDDFMDAVKSLED